MWKDTWIILLVVGIIIIIIALVLIEKRIASDNTGKPIPTFYWILLFIGVILIITSFAFYIYYSDVQIFSPILSDNQYPIPYIHTESNITPACIIVNNPDVDISRLISVDTVQF